MVWFRFFDRRDASNLAQQRSSQLIKTPALMLTMPATQLVKDLQTFKIPNGPAHKLFPNSLLTTASKTILNLAEKHKNHDLLNIAISILKKASLDYPPATDLLRNIQAKYAPGTTVSPTQMNIERSRFECQHPG